MMHIPTQQQWQTVIDKLYSILPLALEFDAEHPGECHLEMHGSDVNQRHPCGTTHCVGGWYAIAHWRDEAFDTRNPLSYTVGARHMGVDLGFSGPCAMYGLERWAKTNEHLWGNPLGRFMFSEVTAYDHSNGPLNPL